MKNKNILKKTALLSGIIALPVLLSRGSFKLSQFSCKDTDEEGFFYDSSFGPIHYNIKGVGEPLLLIHSVNYLGASMKEWEQNVDELSYKYKVITIDLPSFGKSEKTKTTFTAYNYALIINKFITDVVGEPCNVIASGTSCGFALMSNRLESGNIKKLMLINPTGITESDIPQNYDTRILRLHEMPYLGTILYALKSSKANINRMLESKVFYGKENITDDFREKCRLYAHRKGVDSKFAFASYVSKFMDTDIKATFEGTKTPLYVVWGEENVVSPIENVDILEELRPDVTFAIFEYTRMLPHYENSEKFNAIVEEFFN